MKRAVTKTHMSFVPMASLSCQQTFFSIDDGVFSVPDNAHIVFRFVRVGEDLLKSLRNREVCCASFYTNFLWCIARFIVGMTTTDFLRSNVNFVFFGIFW